MKRFISFISFLSVIALLIPSTSRAEEIIKKGELVTLDRSIEIALKRHPNIIAAESTISANESKVGQAKASYFPQINASAGYSRTSPVSSSSGISSGTGPSAGNSNNSYDQYSSNVILQQNIYDFGKTKTQVNIQGLNLNSSRSDFANVTEQIILNVRQAYYGVLKAKRSRDVLEETVKQSMQHLEQAKGFYEVGRKPKFDVTKAEVDLSNARLNLIRAENSLRIAKVSLNNAMGVPDAPEYLMEDNLSFQKHEIIFEDAVAQAFKSRNDLLSLLSKKKAAEESIELAKKGFYPALTGNAAYNWSGRSFPLDDGWNIGMNLTLPIFSGYLTKNQVEEAKANLNVIRANEESLKQNIFLEVQQALLNLTEAEERISVSELAVKQASENYEIASGRYAAGVGNPIEVTDAEVALSNAKTGHIQALYDYKIASANLQKAMGLR